MGMFFPAFGVMLLARKRSMRLGVYLGMNFQASHDRQDLKPPRIKPMIAYSPSFVEGILQILDILSVLMAAIIADAFGVFDRMHQESTIFIVVFTAFVFISLARRAKLYQINAIMRPISRFDDVLVAVTTSTLLLFTVVISLNVQENFPARAILIYTAITFALMGATRAVISRYLRRLSAQKVISARMAVLGSGEQARRFLRHVSISRPFFTTVIGVFSDDRQAQFSGETIENYPLCGGIEELLAYARGDRIDDVVIALPWNAGQMVTSTIERLKELPINVYLSTDLVGFDLAFRPVMSNFNQLPMYEIVQRPISGWSSLLKTLEDYILAFTILILIMPLMIFIAIIIKIDSPGPVFFMQKRLGFNNKEFSIYKFRSMYHRQEPERVVQQASRDDKRVTRVGRIIRALSIDELPQLLNVLDGTMSIVGPRPHALSHNEEYGQSIRGYFARHKVKPGITGWAQVNGLRGETDTIDKMEARINYDIYYADNWSLFFDIKILIMTAFVVFFQKSAY